VGQALTKTSTGGSVDKMTGFRIVPDSLREREPVRRGRSPTSPLAKALLAGSTVFIPGPKKTWGNLYTLAKNHNKKARTKTTLINGDAGILVWFEDQEPD
jgi:hypothetical protein